MREETLARYMTRLGMWPLKRSGQNHFKMACLFQETRHAKGFDTHPSATVSADTFPSWFSCFACETKMPLWRAVLLTCLRRPGSGWARIAEEIKQAEEQEQPITLNGIRAPKIDVPVDMTVELRQLISDGGMDYPQKILDFLEEKNVSVDTARSLYWCFVPAGYENKHMTKDENGDVVPALFDSLLFPMLVRRPDRPEKVMCVGAAARPVPKKKIKYITLFPYNAGSYLYGEHLLPTSQGQPFFVVEGPLDAAHLLQEGFPAGSLSGLHVTPARCGKIARGHAGPVFLFLDPDQRERKSVETALTSLKKKNADVRLVNWPTDPKYCTKEDLRKITGYDPPAR